MVGHSSEARASAKTRVILGSKPEDPWKGNGNALEVGRRHTDPHAPPPFQPEVWSEHSRQLSYAWVTDDNLATGCQNRERTFSTKTGEPSAEIAPQHVKENLPNADSSEQTQNNFAARPY